MLDHDWPGNVRELENELLRATALSDAEIEPSAFSPKLQAKGSRAGVSRISGVTLKAMVDRYERETLIVVLQEHGGKVASAAKALGLTRAGLYKKINRYDLNVDKR